MKVFATALRAEARKFRSSRAALAASTLLLVGLIALPLTFVAAARADNAVILARLGALADGTLWEIHVGSAIQIAGAGCLLACGLVLAWCVGREFQEGTVSALFGLPVGRAQIAIAKVLVYLAWSTLLAVVATSGVVAAGIGGGLGTPEPAAMAMLARLPVLVVSSALIAVPAGLLATVGRGVLPGLGAVVVTVVIAQISVFGGVGPWIPLATPARWAIDPSSVPVEAWWLVPVVPVGATALIAWAWHRLQLDR